MTDINVLNPVISPKSEGGQILKVKERKEAEEDMEKNRLRKKV